MAQYTQRTQPMHRPGQTDHGHGGGALAYGGKPPAGAVVAPPQPRPTGAPYAPQPYQPAQLRLHQPGYGSAALSYRDSSYVRGGGAVSEYRGGGGVGGRVSLLPAAYMPPPAPAAHHPPPADPPPFKKIRLTAERPPPTPLPHHQPIRVDTREPVNQYNTVEVLSPNPPSESNVEDQTFRTTKDELLQQISKVDREMALSESALAKLKKKQVELEQTATKPAKAEEPEETPTHHRSLPQCIYAENRKKAATAHGVLSHLGPPVLYPLYNQPQDTEVYHENIRKHRLFRKRLADHIRRIKLEAEKREDLLAEEYTKRAAEWARRVERIEQSQKRKTKDARNREFFEKVFPELRKQREERERFNRLGARVKSEAELEEIADGLHEQEHEDKKMRSLTVVPPLLRDPRDTRPIYIDTNRRCMDMKSEHKELQLRNIWTQAEKDIFREKYLQHPKNFGQIASFLPRKTVRDCVRFYYLSKKAENYKQLLRKPRQRRNPRKMVEPELPAGVTTRLQRSQGRVSDAKEGGTEENVVQAPDPSLIPIPPAAPAHPVRTELIRTPPLPPSPPPASSAPLAPVTSTPTSTSINIIPLSGNLLPVPTAGCSARTELIRTPPLPPSPPPASSAPLAPVTSTPTSTSLSIISIIPPPGSPSPTPTPVPPPTPPLSTPSSVEAAMPVTSAEVTLTVTPITTSSVSTTSSSSMSAYVTTSTSASVSVTAAVSASGSAPPTPQPAQPPTPTQPPPTPEAVVIERTATPSSTATSTTTTVGTTSSPLDMVCAVCNVSGATRTVSRTRAVHYGLKEDAVGARVCEACHCRCVRSRYTRCPVPTCPGPRVRAKRLRHLPPRWHDLSTELKRPLMEEFQIPSELSKCCLACFKRITRRLETVGEGGSAPEPTDEEASRFRSLLREHGTAWDRIAAVSGRTPASLKAFYFTYRKKLQLEQAVCERGPPAAASGVRCSSSDESCVSSGDTDTASGGSPARGALPPQAPPPPVVPRRSHGSSNVASHATRDDYDDSSATETADEENDAPSAKQINLPPTSIPLPTTIPPSSSSASAPSPTPATVTVSTISGPTSGATGVIGSSGAPAVTGVPVVTGVTSGVTGTSTVSVLGTRNGPAAPQTVRDVVLNIIEISLTRDPQPSSLKPQHLKVSSTTSTRESLATLSVVNNSHLVSSSPAPVSPQRPATITPVPHQGPAAHDKEPHAGHDGGRQERPEPLLDLRVNKRLCHEPPFPHPNKPIIRNSTESVHYTSYRAAPERDSPNQYNCKPKPPQQPPRGPLKPAQNPKGSIILGTPVEVRGQTRRTPEPKAGSITAGTPLHHLPDKRAYEPYARRSPARTYYATPTSQPRPQSPSFSPTGGGTYRSPYGIEQRQIMLADFITSQQMHGGARRERTERGSPPQFGSFPGQFSPGRRDREPVSVIQRHTPHVYPHHHPPPPPGHEAFTSLVDVASAATALPVPSGEGKPEGKHHLPHPHPHPHHQQHPHHHQQQQHQQHQQQHQQHQQQMHGMQSHDVRIRDLPTKYHQMPQYQVLDRRVSQHAPAYIERDRIAIQQRRDTERAMALQERHAMEQHQQHQQQQHQQHQQQQQQQHQQQQQQHQQQQQQQQKQHQQQQQQQHQQHQQTMIHERHHMQHTQNVVSQESDRRLATTAAYSTASGLKHRAHTPHHIDRKDGRPVVSSAGVGVGVGVGVAGNVGVGVGVGGAAVGGAEPRAGTLTAASLIDAIITHQISQTSEQRFPQQGGRDCDNGNPAPQERQDRGPTPAERDREREEHTPAHITSIKLGELASNIITRDFCSPAASMVHHNRFASGATSEAYPSAGAGATVGVMSSGAGGGQAAGGQPPTDEWKRRDPPKHAPYLEPVSPPDNHHPNRNNSNRRYSCVPGSGSGVLTAFDYVTTRIVEVMRSDADERTKQPLAFPTANYTYPFSALNVTAAPQDGSAPTTSAPSAPAPNPAPLPPPEPAPLMSAQYEPLSDED